MLTSLIDGKYSLLIGQLTSQLRFSLAADFIKTSHEEEDPNDLSSVILLVSNQEHLEGDVNELDNTCWQETAEGQHSGAADLKTRALTSSLMS